ncbi:hypothetical protein [Sphingomonas beigongshangi]|uniref:hypothetical protein n=1 Tax=Sphingomonas beigongshangi TaxID=2782540 RepID=UPI001AEE1AA4|nr:hypothetical protein [Sphingomonas beigongshangi]
MTPERILLKRATSDMVKGVGGVEAAAAFTRVGKTMLAEYGSVNRSECFAPIDVIADLEPLARERSGWPHVTQALCRTMGGVFVALPDVPITGSDLFEKHAELAREACDVTGAICDGMKDGKWDPEDGAKLEKHCDDLLDVVIRMRALARFSQGKSA